MGSSIFKLYSVLFDYPDREYVQTLAKLQQKLRPQGHSQPAEEQLELFIKAVESLDLAEIQEIHTRTFDLSPLCSPHVGFHLFGESYKRGLLMAHFKEEYAKSELPGTSEIPDHLFLVLSYCAVLISDGQEEAGDELITLLLLPALEKMTALFAGSDNAYQYLLGSLFAWVNSIHHKSTIEV